MADLFTKNTFCVYLIKRWLQMSCTLWLWPTLKKG